MSEETGKKRNAYGGVFSDKPLDEHVDAYKEQQAKFASGGGGGGNYPVYLDVEEGTEAEVRFLEKDPIKFWQHRVYDPSGKNGRGGYRVFSCTRTATCPLCLAGDKPSFKVAWQVVHIDNLDKNGNVVPRVKLFVKGIRFAEYYDAKTQKKDPTKQNVTLERIGSGQNTQYLFSEWGAAEKIEYDKTPEVDLEEYFGLDDEKYADMERIAGGMAGSKQGQDEYEGPKKGKKSRLETGDVEDKDIPF